MDRLRIDLCELLTNSVLEILKKSNYMTVADVVLTPPEEIAEICSLPLKDVKCIQRILMAQRAAKLVSGADMFREVLSSAGCISTGIPSLDSLLDGGILCGEIIEFYGASASGKTQMCFHISAHVSATTSRSILYIDSCGSFSSRRIKQIMQANGLSEDDSLVALSQIIYCPCNSVHDLFTSLESVRRQITEGKKRFDLIVIDSIAMIFVPVFGVQSHEGVGLMNKAAELLKTLVERCTLAVVVTNHLVKWKNEIPRPGLGKYWAYVPNIRLQLSILHEPGGPYRLAEVQKSVRTVTGRKVVLKLGNNGVLSSQSL